jgi:hypothetical protein
VESKPYAAFGYVLVLQSLRAGERITDEMMLDNIFTVHDGSPGVKGNIGSVGFGYVWFLRSGLQSYRNIHTGKIDVHEPGWCNLVNLVDVGVFEFESITDSQYVCFSPVLNKNRNPRIPELDFVEIQEGESRVFPIGTNLYVLDGELAINEKIVPSMRQVYVKSNNLIVLAKKKTYGYIFKA